MKEYLDKIKNYSKHLKTVAHWKSTGKSLHRLTSKTANEKDYVYEFYCYLVILKDLKTNYNLEYYSGSGIYEHVFPKAPSLKDNRPFFYLCSKINNKKLYQVCAGTEIKGFIDDTTVAPDISFQNANASLTTPDCTDILMIYDAKRNRGGIKDKVSKGQFAYFSNMIVDLNLNKNTPKIKFKKFPQFNGNCLITNKSAFSENILYNKRHKIKSVENFDHSLNISRIKIYG